MSLLLLRRELFGVECLKAPRFHICIYLELAFWPWVTTVGSLGFC